MYGMKYCFMEEASPEELGGGAGSDLNIEEASDSLAADLGLGLDTASGSATPSPGAETAVEDKPQPAPSKEEGEVDPVAVVPRTAPKSWAADKHEVWSKLDPAAQEYIELREKQMLDGLSQYSEAAKYAQTVQKIVQPYEALFRAQNVQAPVAIESLLNAHYQLSTFGPTEKSQYFAKLAKFYGVDMQAVAAVSPTETAVDPAVKALRDKVDSLAGALTATQQAQLKDAQTKVATEVASFTADPANAYFDEVANDIVLLLRDPKLTLKEAYDRAVWANPATRAKEQARLHKETEGRLRKEADEEARKAATAKGTAVRGRQSAKGSTDPVGSMEDTMREQLAAIHTREAG